MYLDGRLIRWSEPVLASYFRWLDNQLSTATNPDTTITRRVVLMININAQLI
jgi:hypothetical protein